MSNFLFKAVRLRKYRDITLATEPPTVIHAIHSESRKGSRSQGGEAAPSGSRRGRNQLNSTRERCFPVHYKPTKNQESQMTRYHIVENDDLKLLMKHSRTKVQV